MKSSNAWSDHDGAVKDTYSIGINNNFSNNNFTIDANSASITTNAVGRHEMNNSTQNVEGNYNDGNKKTWRRSANKTRDNKGNDVADDNMNEFDFTSQRQSATSANNYNEHKQSAFVDDDVYDHNDHYATTVNTRSSYLYDDTTGNYK